jgi:hypothetical protein
MVVDYTPYLHIFSGLPVLLALISGHARPHEKTRQASAALLLPGLSLVVHYPHNNSPIPLPVTIANQGFYQPALICVI